LYDIKTLFPSNKVHVGYGGQLQSQRRPMRKYTALRIGLGL